MLCVGDRENRDLTSDLLVLPIADLIDSKVWVAAWIAFIFLAGPSAIFFLDLCQKKPFSITLSSHLISTNE